MSCSERLALAVACVVAAAAPARADKAAADAAFAEAKRLVAAGKIGEACPKFELSYKEDPQLGTLLNVADCHERLGKLATAWAEFREAMELAKQRGDDREAFARERIDKLAPRVSYVTLVKTGAPADLHVTLDGRDVGALVGVAIPIDPGKHVVTTRAGGGPEASTTITIARDGDRREVAIPLAPAAAPAGSAAPARSGRTRRIAALATAGAGVVATGVGLYFGKRAFDQYDDSRAYCDDANRCEPKGAALIDDARSSALTSNILVGVGVGAIAVGAMLWLTAPSREEHRVTARGSVGRDRAVGMIELRF